MSQKAATAMGLKVEQLFTKSGGEVRSLNRVYLINNQQKEQRAALAESTSTQDFHVSTLQGLSTSGEGISNYISRKFIVGVVKTIYTAKASFSDDLLKGIRLSPIFEGLLLPAKFM